VLTISKALGVIQDPWTQELKEHYEYEERRKAQERKASKEDSRPTNPFRSKEEVDTLMFWDFLERGHYNERVRVVSCKDVAEMETLCSRKLQHFDPVVVNIGEVFLTELGKVCEDLSIPQKTIQTAVTNGPDDSYNWGMLQSLIGRFWHKVIACLGEYTVLTGLEVLQGYGCLRRLVSLEDHAVVLLAPWPVAEDGAVKGLPFRPAVCRAAPWPGSKS
jgi:hypothetical protein